MMHKASSLYLDQYTLKVSVLHSRVNFIRQEANHTVAFHSYLCNDVLNQAIQTTRTNTQNTHMRTNTQKTVSKRVVSTRRTPS
jgi:hypothetical protein